MLVDGRALARDITTQLATVVASLATPPHLTVFTCEPTAETQQYLRLKQRVARQVGVSLSIVEFGAEVCEQEILLSVAHAVPSTNGIVVQLPFPPRIDSGSILTVIPPTHDVDGLTYDGSEDGVLPPVVGAIKLIAEAHGVTWRDRRVTVVGHGRLVGAPAALWAKRQGAIVSVVTEASPDRLERIKEADILILGAGAPGLVTASMVAPGAVVFDAGTSEAEGVVVGDAAPDVAQVSSLLTPVPGGIGPLTIAVLMHNLVTLARRQ